jgi:hypothetical protein
MQTIGGLLLMGMYIPRVMMLDFPSSPAQVAITTTPAGPGWRRLFSGSSFFMTDHALDPLIVLFFFSVVRFYRITAREHQEVI